jgi:glycosyltransferase involved in cell wall biosynthesis
VDPLTEVFAGGDGGRRGTESTIPRIGFLIEQALGHVTYGMGLKSILASRSDMVTEWIPVPYDIGQFRRLPFLGNNWTVRGSIRARQAVKRATRVNKFDALFVHTQTISLGLSSFMRQVPTVVSIDATPKNFDELGSVYGTRLHGPVEQLKLAAHKSVMKNVACFVAWSRWVRESLVHDYGVGEDRIVTINPGTNYDNFPDPFIREAKTGDGPLRVLFVGGDFARKGGDLLLRVCRSMPGQVELHIVTGRGDLKPEPGVHVYTDIKPLTPEIFERFREADVFVLPTRADCFANVLSEAMASSLPIITTRVGAHAEAIEEGKNGFLIDVDDEEQLADRLLTLAQDPEMRERMGRESRRIGASRFNLRTNANRIGDILVSLAHRRTGLQYS